MSYTSPERRRDLTLLGAREYETVQSNTDPLLGGSQAVLEFVTFSVVSLGQLFVKPVGSLPGMTGPANGFSAKGCRQHNVWHP